MTDPIHQAKFKKLTENLAASGRLALAFSGGVDSAFLLKAARETLPPENILALTARADLFPRREAAEAAELAASLGLTHLIIDFDALAVPQVAANPPDRCYHCKRALFEKLLRAAAARGFPVVADGANLDDADDFRPGARAVRELGVVSPLKQAGLTKAEIRELSRYLGLPTWDKPAFACLASRFPYGQALTPEDLVRVEKAEDLLLSLGFKNIRVRSHGRVARLEVEPQDRPRFFSLELMDRLNADLKTLGFEFAALDLGGYRSGALNQSVDQTTLDQYRQ